MEVMSAAHLHVSPLKLLGFWLNSLGRSLYWKIYLINLKYIPLYHALIIQFYETCRYLVPIFYFTLHVLAWCHVKRQQNIWVKVLGLDVFHSFMSFTLIKVWTFISHLCNFNPPSNTLVLVTILGNNDPHTYQFLVITKDIQRVKAILEYFCCMTGNTGEAWSCCSKRSDGGMLWVWLSCSTFVPNEHV
jgi:hypothetical protein